MREQIATLPESEATIKVISGNHKKYWAELAAQSNPCPSVSGGEHVADVCGVPAGGTIKQQQREFP